MEQKSKKAVIALIGANAIPLLGVLIFDWSIFSIMIAYWLENFVIGLYNIIKMSKAEAPNPVTFKMNNQPLKAGAKTGLIGFFIMHFGIFTLVHGIFVIVLFGVIPASSIDSTNTITATHWGQLDITIWGILLMFIALLISHGISYRTNFIERGEYKKISPAQQMFKPYGRVIVMHLIILGSGFLIGALGTGYIFASTVIIAKTILDFILHSKEHFKIWKSGSISSGSITENKT